MLSSSAVGTENVSRYFQISPEGQKWPHLRTTALGQYGDKSYLTTSPCFTLYILEYDSRILNFSPTSQSLDLSEQQTLNLNLREHKAIIACGTHHLDYHL